MKISIITPTYNRAYILKKCFESLCKQTCKDFEWIIADDGSTDGTTELVQEFKKQATFDIKYLKQQNGGKHRAHNLAVKNANGDLTVCLDSDDQLLPTTIEEAINIWKIQSTKENIGILALRGDLQNHKPICSRIPAGISNSTITNLRDKYGFEGDTALFFRTKLLKDHPFREFEGEKFLTETNLYCELDQFGTMILIDKPLYLCEYREDGLTAKYHQLLYDNPIGASDTYYRMAISSSSLIKALKYSIISNAYNLLIPQKSRINYGKKKTIMTLGLIGSPVFARKYFRKFKNKLS